MLRLDRLQFVDSLPALGFLELRETLAPFAGGERFARSGHLMLRFFFELGDSYLIVMPKI